MKPNILKNNLLNPGSKFIATSEVKDNTLPPNSEGFFSHFINPDRDYQNVVHGVVTIIRRGKTGQQRVEAKEISFPVFTDKRMLKHEDYLPIGRKMYLHIKERESFIKSDLSKIASLDFIGWALAYSSYLKYIVTNFIYPAKKARWSDETIDRTITRATRIPSLFNEDSERTLDTFSTLEYRNAFVMAIRKLESKLVKCTSSYKKSVVASVLNSSHFVAYTNQNYYKIVDEKLVDSTVLFYKEKYNKLDALDKRNGNNEMKRGQ